MIHGVSIKQLKVIPDDRGFLMEMLRCDDKLFEKFGQVYMTGCIKGVAKAWHYHREQVDHFVCVSGSALVVLCDWRSNSPTHGRVQEFILKAPAKDEDKTGSNGDIVLKNPDSGNILLKIPSLVLHGFTAFECEEARIINIPTIQYNYDNPDEFRLAWNSAEVPYTWPQDVVRGG